MGAGITTLRLEAVTTLPEVAVLVADDAQQVAQAVVAVLAVLACSTKQYKAQ